MEPPALTIDQAQSMADVARILQEVKKNPALTREFRDAAAHRKRDNGSMGLFLDSTKNLNYVSPRQCVRRPASVICCQEGVTELPGDVIQSAQQPRIHGTAGLQNLNKSRHADVANLLITQTCSDSIDKPRPRVVSVEAEENCNKHRVGTMKDLLNVEANRRIRNPPPPSHNLTREAMENHDKHTGSVMADLLTQPKPKAALNSAAPAKKNCHEQSTCAKVLRGELPGDPVPEARVKYSGKEIYEKHRGTLTSLISEYGRTNPDLDRPQMKRCDEKRFEGSMRLLMEEYGKPQPRTKPDYRVRSADAKRFAKTSSGSSMGSYFNDTKSYKTNSYHKWPNY